MLYFAPNQKKSSDPRYSGWPVQGNIKDTGTTSRHQPTDSLNGSSNLYMNMKSFEDITNANSMTATPDDDNIYENIDATMAEGEGIDTLNKSCFEKETVQLNYHSANITNLQKH